MKKPKQLSASVLKKESEFSSSLTPEINAGKRSLPHPHRFSLHKDAAPSSSCETSQIFQK